MVFNVCVKFHENMSSGFKVMERTQKLLTDTHTHTHTERKDENIIPPWHTSYAGGITSKDSSGTGRIRTRILFLTSKGKMDKNT